MAISNSPFLKIIAISNDCGCRLVTDKECDRADERNLPKAIHVNFSEERPVLTEDGRFVVEVFIENEAKGLFVKGYVRPSHVTLDCAPC